MQSRSCDIEFSGNCFRTTPTRGAVMKFDHMSDAEIFALANPIMDNLMEASTAIDHERHIRDFSDRMKSIVTKEYFQKVCETYQRERGFFAAREPIAAFKRPGAVAIVCKQRLRRVC